MSSLGVGGSHPTALVRGPAPGPKKELGLGVEVGVRARGWEQEERGQGGQAAQGGSPARLWGPCPGQCLLVRREELEGTERQG